MVRRGSRGFVENAYEMEFAHRGDPRDFVEIERLGEMPFHVSDDAFDRGLVGFGGCVAARLEGS